MNKKYRILIAEDHTLLREGLKSLLGLQGHIEIVGEAEDGLQALRDIFKLEPDLVLLDLSMPKMNGMEVISEIKRSDLRTKVMILTVHKTQEYIFESLKAGADGYLLKDAKASELFLAIDSVLAGKTYISPDISDTLVQAYLKDPKDSKHPRSPGPLTRREKQILKLIAEGNTNRKIGDFLCISYKTVEKHRSNLMKKLDLHSAADLTAYAYREGMI